MDLRETSQEAAFRCSIRKWLSENLPDDRIGQDDGMMHQLFYRFAFRRKWHRKLYEGGWVGLQWPAQYGGRGLGLAEQLILNDELARAEAPPIANWVGTEIIGPTLIQWGTEEQKCTYLPSILNGDDVWCQAWSEAEAGSDLAAVRTTATQETSHWVINGVKRWTSWAQFAHNCMVLVRVGDPQLRHRSLACVIVPMNAPGITVKPILMMNGEAEENEVIFDSVRVPASNVVGSPTGGWDVVLSAMRYARGTATLMRAVELEVMLRNLERMAQVLPSAAECKLARPDIRRQLTRIRVRIHALRYLSYRKNGDMESATTLGAVSSIEKLTWSRLTRELTELALHVQGAQGVAGGRINEEAIWARWREAYFRAKANAIEGGTDEIQKNTIAKRALGIAA